MIYQATVVSCCEAGHSFHDNTETKEEAVAAWLTGSDELITLRGCMTAPSMAEVATETEGGRFGGGEREGGGAGQAQSLGPTDCRRLAGTPNCTAMHHPTARPCDTQLHGYVTPLYIRPAAVTAFLTPFVS